MKGLSWYWGTADPPPLHYARAPLAQGTPAGRPFICDRQPLRFGRPPSPPRWFVTLWTAWATSFTAIFLSGRTARPPRGGWKKFGRQGTKFVNILTRCSMWNQWSSRGRTPPSPCGTRPSPPRPGERQVPMLKNLLTASTTMSQIRWKTCLTCLVPSSCRVLSGGTSSPTRMFRLPQTFYPPVTAAPRAATSRPSWPSPSSTA